MAHAHVLGRWLGARDEVVCSVRPCDSQDLLKINNQLRSNKLSLWTKLVAVQGHGSVTFLPALHFILVQDKNRLTLAHNYIFIVSGPICLILICLFYFFGGIKMSDGN